MTEEDRKFMAEQMGLCWHDVYFDRFYDLYTCRICKIRSHYPDGPGIVIPDFTTWEGFGLCFEWARKQDWWDEFWDTLPEMLFYNTFPTRLIGPALIPELVKFLRERKEKKDGR